MHPDAKTLKLDPARFAPQANTFETYYGLPEEIAFCSSCVISNQRPSSAVEYKHTTESKKSTIRFDANGICDACRLAERKSHEIDWERRERELQDLCDRFRSRTGHYDCVVPGSGGKDSFYAAHMLKYKYGMNPLTVTWAPHMYTDWGWRNFNRWIHAGFDNWLMTPSGTAKRLLTRLAVENLFHPFQPFIIGQKSIAAKLAAKENIPLVFYGENEAEYGNPIEDTESAQRAWEFFAQSDESEIFLGGESLESLKLDYGLRECDLDPYMPLSPDVIREKGVEVHYLGYYIRWHPQSAYYYSVEHGGFEASPERTAGTYSKYNSIDDKIDDFHYYTTYIKFGIGRATYDAAQEVRSGDLDREEASLLVRRYDGEFPERFAEEVFNYLSIDEKTFPKASKMFDHPMMDRSYFDALANKFRSPHLWKLEDSEWKLRKQVFDEVLSTADV